MKELPLSVAPKHASNGFSKDSPYLKEDYLTDGSLKKRTEPFREEIIDREGAVFRIGEQTPAVEMKQETYIPRSEAIVEIKKIEQRSRNKVQQYQQYAQELKDKYSEYEMEAENYYKELLDKQKEKSQQQLQVKEQMLQSLEAEKTNTELQIKELQDHIRKAKKATRSEQTMTDEELLLALYKPRCETADQEVLTDSIGKECRKEQPRSLQVSTDDFKAAKANKQRLKGTITKWIVDFEKENGRKPSEDEKAPIQSSIQEYEQANEEYLRVKLQLQKSRLLQLKTPVVQDQREQIVKNVPTADPQRESEIQALQQKLDLKGSKVAELQSQIERLSSLIADNVGADQVLQSLQQMLEEKTKLIEERDQRIEELLEQQEMLRESKEVVLKDLEAVSKDRDESVENKEPKQTRQDQKLRRDSGVQQDSGLHQNLAALQKENQSLREQIALLQQAKQATSAHNSSQPTNFNSGPIMSHQTNFQTAPSLESASRREPTGDVSQANNFSHSQQLQAMQASQNSFQLLSQSQQRDLEGALTKLEQFNQKLEKRKQKAKALKAENQALHQELQERSGNDQEVEALNQRHKQQIQELQMEIDSLRKAQQSVGQSAESNLLKAMEQHKENTNKIKEEAAKEIEKREQELQVFKMQLEKSEANRFEQQEKVTDLEIAMERKVQEQERLKQQMEELGQAAGEANRYKNESEQLSYQLSTVQEQYEAIEAKFKEEQTKRKQLHNQLEDMKGKIRVFCRVRPLSKTELERDESKLMAIQVIDEFSLAIHGRNGIKNYNFDSIFSHTSTQEEVFEETKRLVQSAVDGFNVCIFAYGQTGSGKTHTIQGSPGHPGITPKAIDEMFAIAQSMSNHRVVLKCYMVELYKDELRDLLLTKNQPKIPLEIKESAAGLVVIQGVTEIEIKSVPDANKHFTYGLEHRMTRATKMNDSSSRSHLIYAIIIESTNKQTGVRTVGKLSFVDLAGSENQKKTGTDKQGADEARAINQSLSALGNVISALSEGASHIPYRNHPLTKLMKDSIGGSAKTLMFVNVSPSNYNEAESKNSLDYATRVKKIKNKVNKNVESVGSSKLKFKIQLLEQMFDKSREIIQQSNMKEQLAALDAFQAQLYGQESGGNQQNNQEEEKDHA